METLAIIPARGGSKGLTRKNLRILAGKPLVSYVIEVALRSRCIDRIIVSTDDNEIRDLAIKSGAEAPFLRPNELSTDDTPDFPVICHILDYLKNIESVRPNVVVHLRPTYPLIFPEDIDRCVELISQSDADSTRSVCPVSEHPYWMMTIKDDSLVSFTTTEPQVLRRQDLPPVYKLSGIDVTKTNVITNQNKILGQKVLPVITDQKRAIDIDTPFDLALAESIITMYKDQADCPDWW